MEIIIKTYNVYLFSLNCVLITLLFDISIAITVTYENKLSIHKLNSNMLHYMDVTHYVDVHVRVYSDHSSGNPPRTRSANYSVFTCWSI